MRSNRPVSLFLALLVCVSASLFPRPVHAAIAQARWVYYNKCGTDRVVVGFELDDCDDSTTTSGVTSDYYKYTEMNCISHVETTEFWACGVQVSSLDTCNC